ncbi:MAG: ATP-binding cassette, subfamily bacterial CydC [Mycobacteriales bacterium]
MSVDALGLRSCPQPAAAVRLARRESVGGTAFASLGGLLLAVLAEACSVGLLGLSGWFVASCAVAGAGAYSAFSYVDPSGGVRAFAVGRIAANYASRVALHSAALRRVGAARLGFYDRAAAQPSTHGRWSGQSLDRVMADADTQGMALIQATAPMTVAAALTVGGCLAIALAGHLGTALVVAASAALSAALGVHIGRRRGDDTLVRGALRTELVAAIDAWPEMASLGATGHLAHRVVRQLAVFESRGFRRAVVRARTLGAARALTAVALLLAVCSTAASADVAAVVFVALVTVGVMGNAERLIAAAEARAVAGHAGARLASAGSDETCDRGGLPVPPAIWHSSGLTVSGYGLPATPTRDARQVSLRVAPGHTLVVTGASGSGKTTLLSGIAVALRQPAASPGLGAVSAVLADDHLFTGTVASNVRLANPAATDDDIRDLLAAVLLDRTGLGPATEVGTGGRDLSGGERRRLHIARALATRPGVLLVDEPTTGLDADTATHVLQAIRRRLPRAVLVLAMHELPADPRSLAPNCTTVSLD